MTDSNKKKKHGDATNTRNVNTNKINKLTCLLVGERELLCSLGLVALCTLGLTGRRTGLVLRNGDLLRWTRDGLTPV